MTKYFKNVESYIDLKTQYRKLAVAFHPDNNGCESAMKLINREYDQLFAIWKCRDNVTNNETAASTRNEFYTQYGWKGENYKSNLTLKEIANIVREFIKIHHSNCKFSVTTSYASMCQELHIFLMESPYKAYKSYDELTNEDKSKLRHLHIRRSDITSWHTEELDKEIKNIYDEQYSPYFLTTEVKEIITTVGNYADSFNYDDSDPQIDYCNTNFYFFGVRIGKYDKPYKVVEREKKNVTNVVYENVEVTKTRTFTTLEPRDIETPSELKEGQYFQLKSSFNLGCSRGTVYQITTVDRFILGVKMGKGYKKLRTGNIRGNKFYTSFEDFDSWITKGSIAFIELVEVTKTENYTSVVRRPKKQTGLTT